MGLIVKTVWMLIILEPWIMLDSISTPVSISYLHYSSIDVIYIIIRCYLYYQKHNMMDKNWLRILTNCLSVMACFQKSLFQLHHSWITKLWHCWIYKGEEYDTHHETNEIMKKMYVSIPVKVTWIFPGGAPLKVSGVTRNIQGNLITLHLL